MDGRGGGKTAEAETTLGAMAGGRLWTCGEGYVRLGRAAPSCSSRQERSRLRQTANESRKRAVDRIR